jgi:quinol-cytochrome oxidoreductase complex cytochrome b subunit
MSNYDSFPIRIGTAIVCSSIYDFVHQASEKMVYRSGIRVAAFGSMIIAYGVVNKCYDRFIYGHWN